MHSLGLQWGGSFYSSPDSMDEWALPTHSSGFLEAGLNSENHGEKQTAASPSDTLTTYKQRASMLHLTLPRDCRAGGRGDSQLLSCRGTAVVASEAGPRLSRVHPRITQAGPLGQRSIRILGQESGQEGGRWASDSLCVTGVPGLGLSLSLQQGAPSTGHRGPGLKRAGRGLQDILLASKVPP